MKYYRLAHNGHYFYCVYRKNRLYCFSVILKNGIYYIKRIEAQSLTSNGIIFRRNLSSFNPIICRTLRDAKNAAFNYILMVDENSYN